MKRALVIDDTKNIRILLTTCLQLNGYEVLTAASGDEALKIFDTETLNLAFLDIKMPGISGTEVLRRIRSIGIDVPVVIMTAFATVKNAVECTKLGAVAYLQKPFTAEKVRSIIEVFENNAKEERTIEWYLDTSKTLLEAGDVDEAYSLLKTALSIDPARSECYELIGKTCEFRGEIEQAHKFYNAAKQF